MRNYNINNSLSLSKLTEVDNPSAKLPFCKLLSQIASEKEHNDLKENLPIAIGEIEQGSTGHFEF
jgi:hypothetical protein